jgi:HlyD family secretion protein
MTRATKIVIGTVAVIAIGAIVVVSVGSQHKGGVEVKTEKVEKRDLTAIVTASGKIRPKRKVDISADVMGRVIELAVDEGDIVQEGALLLRIDPTQYEAAVARAEATLEQARSQFVQAEAGVEQALRALDRAKQLQSSGSDLLSKEALEDAQTRYDVQRATHETAKHGVAVAEAALADARQNLAKTVIRAPMAGRIVRKNIEQGETAIIGTMNNPGSLLLTVADLSEMEALVTVNETDVPSIKLGDPATLEVDALPGSKLTGKVTKIGNSAIQSTGSQEAVDFEVRIAIDSPPDTLRPDLSSTADIVAAERKGVLTIPIIALTVKEVPKEETAEAAEEGMKVEDPKAKARADRVKRQQEEEGVFVVEKEKAAFRPVKVGIAGDNYFEVLSGVAAGDEIVSGTYQAIRSLKDGDRVRIAKEEPKKDEGKKKEKEKKPEGEKQKPAPEKSKTG